MLATHHTEPVRKLSALVFGQHRSFAARYAQQHVFYGDAAIQLVAVVSDDSPAGL